MNRRPYSGIQERHILTAGLLNFFECQSMAFRIWQPSGLPSCHKAIFWPSSGCFLSFQKVRQAIFWLLFSLKMPVPGMPQRGFWPFPGKCATFAYLAIVTRHKKEKDKLPFSIFVFCSSHFILRICQKCKPCYFFIGIRSFDIFCPPFIFMSMTL